MAHIERDFLGEKTVNSDYYGINTARALDNFPFSGYAQDRDLIISMAYVKHAAALTNVRAGYMDARCGEAVIRACEELEKGMLHDEIVVDPFQGGAGTSLNMNFNEVIANRANEILGSPAGSYSPVDPLDHVNMHQSTNDVYPTAVRVAVLFKLSRLEDNISSFQGSLQKKEQEFADIVKLGRTEMRDALPMTLGMEFGAWAEAVSRDRWRIFKCRERIKTVNLGGTALGTGLGAPRDYIFKVTDTLRSLTGLKISRAENLVDATQNADQFSEISGMLRTYAVDLMKIAGDLRILSMGPGGGPAEIALPPLQKGSSIMPGKINPVLPEAVIQIALRVISNDSAAAIAAGSGNLELNHLMPFISFCTLESLSLLENVTAVFDRLCIRGIKADGGRCLGLVEKSPSSAAVFIGTLGYAAVEKIVAEALSSGKTVKDIMVEKKILTSEEIDTSLSPWNMRKLGTEHKEGDEK